MRFLLGVAACGLLAACATTQEEPGTGPVTLASLLEEMTNRAALARLPEPAYVLKQASSHDRATVSPANAETWFANKDHGQFIRVETNDARREWVIMEHEGPGAVVRFWLPLHPPKDDQIIRFYFDASSTPAIAVKLNELLSGRGFVPPPFAFVAWNETDLRNQQKAAPEKLRGVGGDMYLPIPFAKSCKITLDQEPFYYIVNYRAYDTGTEVETFSPETFASARPVLDRVGDALLADPSDERGTKTFEATIAPGAKLELQLPRGPAAVRNLTIRIDPQDAPQILRSLVVTADFDGEQTVWSPVGEFSGTGARLHPVQDWYRRVATDGVMTVRWVMPYRREGRVGLKNLGGKPAAVAMSVAATTWNWDDRSLLFHANWRGARGIATRPMSDWNYIEIDGGGRYVGDTLTVFSPDKAWYGEGDEKVYLDGETLPSHIGTGTEDYYGYAWGMATYFSSPFLSTPQRDLESRSDWRGFTTTSRVRPLDAYTFRSSLKLDMEIWHWADTKVDQAAAMFWYARPGATCNRLPQEDEAAAELSALPPPRRWPGAVECEAMPVLAKSEGLKIGRQERYPFASGSWSDDGQLFVQATKPGDFVELLAADRVRGPVRLVLHGTRSYDYGILRFAVNGQPVDQSFDGFAPRPVLAEPLDLGVFAPKDGKIILRVEVAGANPAARDPRHYFGLDALQVKPE